MNRSIKPKVAKSSAKPGPKPSIAKMAGTKAEAPLQPRKLPRQQRSSATVAAIIEAAASILETEGFDGYNTNDVARRAGASIGSLYQYFPNKTALTQALIAREDAALLVEMEKLLGRPAGMGLLDDLIAVAVAHQLQRPVLSRLLDAEEARLPPSEEAQRLSGVLMEVFQRSLGADLLKASPYVPQDLFSIIHGMVDGAGQRGERDGKVLAQRVGLAVRGYIDALQRQGQASWPAQ